MQKAVDKYSDDENVEFLFVNTWERVEDKLENARKFITNNNYTFHVLMDTENKVVTDFKVSGIPTKFVIDGNGNIRFKSVGGDDNIDRLVDELTAMITLASQGA
jgi:peroxiredoxin